jgi:hypothetical protein
MVRGRERPGRAAGDGKRERRTLGHAETAAGVLGVLKVLLCDASTERIARALASEKAERLYWRVGAGKHGVRWCQQEAIEWKATQGAKWRA